jgi:hypothetical protein
VQPVGRQPSPGGTPHRFAMPDPPQVPASQGPQSMDGVPHPPPTMPQYWPAAVLHLVGLQTPASGSGPQTPGTPDAPQRYPVCRHVPHSSHLPQPSPMRPQNCPPGCVHVATQEPPIVPSRSSEQRALLLPVSRQTSPGEHAEPSRQHGSPLSPQRKQRFATPRTSSTHVRPTRHNIDDAQHSSPSPPQGASAAASVLDPSLEPSAPPEPAETSLGGDVEPSASLVPPEPPSRGAVLSVPQPWMSKANASGAPQRRASATAISKTWLAKLCLSIGGA